MKKIVGGAIPVLAIIAYIFIKFFLADIVTGGVDTSGRDVRLMVNQIIQGIQLREFDRMIEEAKAITAELDEGNQTQETEDEYSGDNSYIFLESFQNVNLYKNQKFADEIGIDMKVFENEEFSEFTNIEIKIDFGAKDEEGYFLDEYYTINIRYSQPNPDRSDRTFRKRVLEKGSITSYYDQSERTGILEYNFDDILPEYKRVLAMIIDSIENYKKEHNNDMSSLASELESGMKPSEPLTDTLKFNYYVRLCDIWEYLFELKLKLAFDDENGTGDGTDGKYKIVTSFKVVEDTEESSEEYSGVYTSTTQKWSGDFAD